MISAQPGTSPEAGCLNDLKGSDPRGSGIASPGCSAVGEQPPPPVHGPCEASRGRQVPGPPAAALRIGMTAVRLHSDLFCSIPGGIICFVLESKRLSRRFRFISEALRPGRGGCFPLGRAWSPLRAEPVPPMRLQLTRLCAATSRDPPLPPGYSWPQREAGSALAIPRAGLRCLAVPCLPLHHQGAPWGQAPPSKRALTGP